MPVSTQTLNYAVARSCDTDDIVDLLARRFSESEPPALAMGLACAEMQLFLRLIVPQAVPCGLTVIGRTQDTGRLAAALLTDDFAAPLAIDLAQVSPKFQPILAMLDELDHSYRAAKAIVPGEYLHLFMLAVDSDFGGAGIAQGLVMACLDNGLRRGYQTALTEATGIVSQRVFRKCGFADRDSVPYQDYSYGNKHVFASIEQHEGAILMERRLAPGD